MQRKTSIVRAWSDKTIKKSLQLRLDCGTSGYEMSIRILHTVMNLLQLKTQTMEDSNKYCGLVMDEMSIKSTLEYDVGGQLVRGYNKLKPYSDELATHALTFALVGVITRSK
ncbi:unnamed protein product [Lepeophtheirus salmonis]|uniref:(salmon louse) hypothetical protein n=1 Tax=Lepeophtheirus salmonis TaxID=72036 RepID=A0A817FF54_LEPSM|nr:unnamed protein product [Lepeophtheirus salmonis]